MTERLRDLVDAEDPAVAELARLVRAADDLDPAPGAQDRVRAELAEDRRSRRRWGPPILVLLVIITLTPVVVAGVRRFVATEPAPVNPVKREDAVPATPPKPIPRGSRLATPPTQPEPPAVVPETPAPVVVPEPRPRAAPPRAAEAPVARTPELAVPAPAPSSPPSAEAALVMEALRLLRQAHDASAALRELDRYRSQFPESDLAEEALALTIEAHTTLGDDASRRLAAEYLQRFPRGRFRPLAEAAQRQFHER